MNFDEQGTQYHVSYDEDGIYLKVCPSSEGLTKKDELDIITYLKRKNIKEVESSAVFEAMYSNPSQKTKIAPPQEQRVLDEELEVRVTDRGMKAYAKLLPPEGGKMLIVEEVYRLLNQHGIVYGIDKGAVSEMLDKRQYGREVCIAIGEEPQNGTDARLIYHVDFKREHKPEIREDGTVDYRHLDLIINVKKGQVLASMIPHTEGKPGKMVTGDTVAAKSGRAARLPKGKNVLISENKLELIAAMDGKADMIDGKINVFAVYEIRQNVDNSTGNIDFIGNVIIKGNVLTGFEVKAGGYIEVWGVVEGAHLIAKGDVVLKQGMQGMERGSIQSQGNVIAKFIENSSVYAKGDILVEAIMHSTVKCGGKISVVGRKGLIVGGVVQAGVEISANIIGSPMATTTHLEVGIDPALRHEYNMLVKNMEDLEEQRKKAEQVLNLLDRMKDSASSQPAKIEVKRKAIRAKLQCFEQLPKIKARMYELQEMFSDVGKGFINVKNIVYPGVKVTIGPSSMYVKEEKRYLTFKRDQGEVVCTTYQG